jgi:hypothetical protein
MSRKQLENGQTARQLVHGLDWSIASDREVAIAQAIGA